MHTHRSSTTGVKSWLGVEPGSKAHRLYDPRQGKIHVSRDVVFEESRKWQWGDGAEADPYPRVSFTIEGSGGMPQEDVSMAQGDMERCRRSKKTYRELSQVVRRLR